MSATTILDNRVIRANQKAKEGRMRRANRTRVNIHTELGHDWEVENNVKVRLSWWRRVLATMKAMIKL